MKRLKSPADEAELPVKMGAGVIGEEVGAVFPAGTVGMLATGVLPPPPPHAARTVAIPRNQAARVAFGIFYHRTRGLSGAIVEARR